MMSKLLLSFVACFSLLAANAQSLAFTTSDSIYMNETSTNSAEELLHKTYVKNVSNDTVEVSWRINSIDAPAGWELSLCDITNCLVVTSTTTNSFDLAPGDSSELKMGYLANNIAGEALVKVQVTALGTGNPAMVMTYKAEIDIDFTNVNDFTSSSFNLYPNPAKNKVFFDLNEVDQVSKIEIYNVIGRKVYEQTVLENNNSINIADLNKGVYVVKLYANNKQLFHTETFVKQ